MYIYIYIYIYILAYKAAALEALNAYPGGLQARSNNQSYISKLVRA